MRLGGFWFAYLSQIFRRPWATRWKSRRHAGRAEKFAAGARKLGEVEFPQLLEKKHKVTEFLKEFVQFVYDVKEAGHSAFQVLFNELTQDLAEEKQIDEVIDILREHVNKMPKEGKNLVRRFLIQAAKRIGMEEHNEREEYWAVNAIVSEAKNFRSDREALMARIRTWFKTKDRFIRVLERFSWRREIAGSKKAITKTGDIKERIRNTLSKIENYVRQNKGAQLSAELDWELNELARDIIDMFNQSYMVKERAILFVFRLIYLAETVDERIKLEVNRHFAPKKSVEEIEDKLGQAVGYLGQEFHDVVEQGFRISIHRLEKEQKKLEALASASK